MLVQESQRDAVPLCTLPAAQLGTASPVRRQLPSGLSSLLSCLLSRWAPCKKYKQCCFDGLRSTGEFSRSASGKRNDAGEERQLCAHQASASKCRSRLKYEGGLEAAFSLA